MDLLAPIGILAVLALPLIVLLYFLKVKRPEVRVATLVLWRRHLADRQANAPWQRLRWSALLLLQLLAAALIAAALVRPGVTGAAGVGKTTVVLIDASASMRATDVGPDRFGAAVARARELAGSLAPGQEMAVVLMGEHSQLLAPPTSDTAALDSALDRASPGGGPSDLGEGISLANAILSGRPGGSIVLIGDGHSTPPAVPPRVAAPVTYLSVGFSDQNAAIETLSRTGAGTVFLRVANFGRQARDLKIEMYADGRLADVLPVHVDGNASTDLTWTRMPAGAQVVEARITPADVFSLDDQAWLLTGAPPPHEVLLVTDENGFLARALALRPGVHVTTVAPKDYKPGRYDLYVFDRFAPGGTLPDPALVIDPPTGQGPVPLGPGIDPGGVLPANPRDPLLNNIDLRDVHVQVAGRATAPAGWRTVISAVDDPLLLAHEGEPRIAELTFDVHHSDLPLRAAFPILVDNLLSYLLPSGFENQAFALGKPVTLAAEPGATEVDVTIPDGRLARLKPPLAPFTDTLTPGVYTVRQLVPGGARLSRFVVEFNEPSLSRVQPGAAPIPFEEEKAQQAPAPRGTLELWPWLVGAVLALLVVEWFLYLNPTGLRIPRLRPR
ncbi:MAG TPA: VWA domain-containing protein [Candidatus Dormibacteraeota bacterium]